MTDTKKLREPLPRNQDVLKIAGTRREPMMAEFATANQERIDAADEIERLIEMLGESKTSNPKASKRRKTDD